MVIFILGLLILLFSSVIIVWEIDDAVCGVGCIILFLIGFLFIVTGVTENCENKAIQKHNINSAVIEYIVDLRNQDDETSITTNDAITIYIECKRNGFNEEETISFLLPDITKEEAKSIVKTYNLIEKEN